MHLSEATRSSRRRCRQEVAEGDEGNHHCWVYEVEGALGVSLGLENLKL
jgi:hypothetical protein